MTVEKAKEILSIHSGRGGDIDDSKWKNGFLCSLRPFRGTLNEDNFVEIMECLKTLKKEFTTPTVDRGMMEDIITITYLSRVWASPDGMLGRNELLTDEQTTILLSWVDIIQECVMWLLSGCEEEAFFSYNEYLEKREQ